MLQIYSIARMHSDNRRYEDASERAHRIDNNENDRAKRPGHSTHDRNDEEQTRWLAQAKRRRQQVTNPLCRRDQLIR